MVDIGPSNDFIIPGKYTQFGIAEMQVIACKSSDGAHVWKDNVSSIGWLRTVRGLLTAYRQSYVDEYGK